MYLFVIGLSAMLTSSVSTREDLGFRWVSEQVSHHPPISAFHAEGLEEDFVFHGSIYPKLKFWGKSIEAEPKGTITLELPKSVYSVVFFIFFSVYSFLSELYFLLLMFHWLILNLCRYNEAYTWTNPTCCVHNIIVGQLWIEQYGNVEVINQK